MNLSTYSARRKIWLLGGALVMLSSTACEKTSQTPRTYTEIVKESPLKSSMSSDDPHAFMNMGGPMMSSNQPPEMQKILEASTAAVHLAWDIPEGWQEGREGGMRLATFFSQEEDAVECSVVSLGGMAGGTEANVQRWAGQINVDLPAARLEDFLAQQKRLVSQGGLPLVLVDFTSLQKQEPSETPSMIAGITLSEDKTIFIKMTGTKSAVSRNQIKFQSFCQSLRMVHE